MTIPNIITFGRLLSVPLIVWLLIQSAYVAVFFLVLMAGISDGLDGYLAKRNMQTSELGAILDPLADKALLVSLYVTLGLQGHLPDWLVVLVVFRDLLIVGGVLLLLLMRIKVRVRPFIISKINTVVQIALTVFVLAQLGFSIDFSVVVNLGIFIVAGLTTISGLSYFVSWTRQTSEIEKDRFLER